MQLEEIFTQAKTGKFIKDTKENKGFIFHGKTLSEIKASSIEDIKELNVTEDIASLAKKGGQICTFLENSDLLLFEGLYLKWRKVGEELGITNSLLRWILMFSLVGSFATIFGFAFIGIWVGILASLIISLLWIAAARFFPTQDWEVYLDDMKGNGKNEVILHEAEKNKFIFLDATGTVIHKRKVEGYKEGSVIKITGSEGERKEIWVRGKKNEGYDTLAIDFEGIKRKLEDTRVIEVFEWDNDGKNELASISNGKIRILTKNGSLLAEKKIPSPYDAYAGDPYGDGREALVVLGIEEEAFFLNVLRGEKLSRQELAISPLFLSLVGLADIDEDGRDEVILKAFWEEKIEFMVYDLKET